MVHMYIFTKYLHIIHIDVFSDVSKSQVGAFSDINCTSVSAFVINFDLLYRKGLSLMVPRKDNPVGMFCVATIIS